MEGLEKVRLFPGIPELLSEASARFPCGIASGTLRDEILAVLRRHGLEACFAGLVTADEQLPSKPAPDSYTRALHVLREHGATRLQAPQCLVVEDSVPGILAAKAAGMHCVAVAHSHAATLLRDADLVLDSVERWNWNLLP